MHQKEQLKNMEDEIILREELMKVLEENPTDYNRIIELSSKLTKFDVGNIRFSVDAGVIDRLGTELVARQETAVSELVKNAYDADAKLVTLKFFESDNIGGILVIEDDGIGMTRNQLVNGFMRISSTDKIHNPTSERYKRQRSGQKGIGRFAVQRLGNKLTITTQTKNDPKALQLVINWDKYKGDLDLINISNTIIEVDKIKEEGTTLKIEGLRDRWSQASIKRIYRFVSDVIQPFPLSVENPLNMGKDTGFKAVFKKVEEGKEITIADETSMIYNHALAIIDGWIDETGIGIYSIESKKLNISLLGQIGSNPDDMNAPFDKLKNVRFRAFYYIYNSDYMPKMVETSISNLARKIGGIRLYRNGFRVLPYGERGNDWIGLDRSTTQRTILPTHRNVNFFGFVELIDLDKSYNETSSREGLIENEAFVQIQNFVYRTLMTGVIKIAEVRKKKITTSQKLEGKIYEQLEFRIKDIAFTIEALDRELEKEEGSIQVKQRRRKKIQKLKNAIQEVEKLQKEEKSAFLKEKSMLRVLGSVGITIGQFIHEVKDYVLNMESDIKFLLAKLKSDEVLINRIKILDNNVATFQSYTSYFDSVISQNVIRELKPIEIQTAAEDFWDSINNDAKKSNIQFDKPIRKNVYLYSLPMHPSEWSSIFFNFYTNAKKAIKRTKKAGKINIECGFYENYVYLEFSDTGDGIAPENEDKIFDEFFTTTSTYNLDDLNKTNEVTGTGLGLKIVKDIVSSYRGNVQVVSPKEGYITCLRVEIPKATDKELDKYGI